MFETATSVATLSSSSQAFSVSEINTMIADLLAAGLPSFLWIEGEVSNLSVAASGHRYLSLKDAGSTISCALFKGSANRIARDILNGLKNGDKIIVKASLSVYKPRGNYQLIISDIEPAGFGALAKAFTALKAKLEREGLMANECKKALPSWSQRVAIVTSDSGAAIRDVVTTLRRRAPFIALSVYPTMVQGEQAVEQIMQALQQANLPSEQNDVILLVRGGGSLEDLQAFNQEALAYAVFNSRLPIVTGVGHETDFTIVDFVSDYRAATPTAAAEIVSADKSELTKQLNASVSRLRRSLVGYHQQASRQLKYASQRLTTQHPQRQLQQQNQRLDELSIRLQRTMQQRLALAQARLQQYQRHLKQQAPTQRLMQWQQRLTTQQQQLRETVLRSVVQRRQDLHRLQQRLIQVLVQFEQQKQRLLALQARLHLLSPLGILDRGYVLVFDEAGRLIKQSCDVRSEESVFIRFADGVLEAKVKK